ncbi:MAG: phosphoribosylformylglycinamidine cyclo-ligase [Proteobacteria bacterium]|nr:phosphoribosylformylglycinamidine cyclo-ligase [Pseudomonadota bacterium]
MENPNNLDDLASYKSAGVDTEKGDALAAWLVDDENSHFHHPKGLGSLTSGIGGFAGLFETNFKNMARPQLVASTDGVGTKLLLGLQVDLIAGLGQDLVAMCVNDLYTAGANPLFFLDYYATGKLSSQQFKTVLTSIKDSCKACGMALMGGETAEMPGLYSPGHFDLAGFVVGVVDHHKRLGSHRTKAGDVLVSLQSSGFHSNGFSLIRKWLSEFPGLLVPELSKRLMTPTKLYHEIITLVDSFGSDFHALSNITGGGISGNLPRVIAQDLVCTIVKSALPTPLWMANLLDAVGAKFNDIEPVFNLGVGMIAVVSKESRSDFLAAAQNLALMPKVIGEVEAGSGSAIVRYV